MNWKKIESIIGKFVDWKRSTQPQFNSKWERENYNLVIVIADVDTAIEESGFIEDGYGGYPGLTKSKLEDILEQTL